MLQKSSILKTEIVMNTNYLNLGRCLCFVMLVLTSLTSSIAQPNFTAKDQVIPDNGPFEFGSNNGYYPGWSDSQLGDLAAGSTSLGIPGVGVTALRPGLFEYYTEEYGNSINLPAFQHYASLGMTNNTLFVGYASDAHKDPAFDCPSPYFNPYDPGSQTRVFANLHEPIWDGGANGTPVNDNNHYALWLYNIVQIYGPYIKYWEIWNEPDLDFSSPSLGGLGWRPPGDPGNWWDNDPQNCDIQFGAPIEYYIRTLRISWEIIKTYDPTSYVAVGGLGYPSFLDAVMRNTDNPVDGSPTAEYPHGGGAYFDALSFHSYPHSNGSLRKWNNNTQGFDYHRHSDRGAQGIIDHKGEFEAVIENYGFGTTYPTKEIIMTESSVPRKQFTDWNGELLIGSEEAAYNFIMKLPVLLQKSNVNQFYVYDLGEKDSYANADHPFDVTGLYEDPVGLTFSTVQRTNSGIAYKTLSDEIFGKTFDATQTANLLLPPEVNGAAFNDGNGNYTYVLWAVTNVDLSETASATYSFPSSFGLGNMEKTAWDYSETNQTSFVSSQNIALTGTPIILGATNQSFIVNCPQNVSFEADGNGGAVASWNNPSASTNCANGAISVSQSTGPGSGSYLQVGSYNITYTVSDNCGNSQNCNFTVTITPPPPPTVGCNGGKKELTMLINGNGSVDIEYHGPNGPTDNCASSCSYCLQNGSVIKLVPKPNAGEVFLGWDGSSGCSGMTDCWKTISWDTEITATFSTNGPTQTLPPLLTAVTTEVSCYGLSDGNVITTLQDGTPPFTYQWNNGQTSHNLNNIPTGTYTVTVTDANGQTVSISKTVSEPTEMISQIVSQTDVSCTGGTDGSITASALGGAPPYSYIWSNQMSSSTITGLNVGNYTVTIYDTNGCSATATTSITAGNGTLPVANFSKTINGPTVNFTDLSSGNPTSWAWDFGDGNTGTGATPSHTYAAAGNYLACVSAANACGQNTFCQNISVGLANDVNLSMGSASANAGTVVQIALYIEGFENIVSFQHAISIADTSKAEFVNISSFDSGIMNASPPTTNVDPQHVSVVWLSSGNPVTIVDGTALYYLDVLVKGDPNECVDIVIDQSILPTEFVMLDNGNIVQVPFNINNSQVCSSAGSVTSGLIAREDGMPIEYVEVYNGGNIDGITNTDGNYQLPPYTLGTSIVIEPHKDINYKNGVTSFDLAIIQQHIVGNALLSTPYKLIAADVNNSGQISAFDLYLAQQVIVGNDSIFPNNESWRFVPETFVFTDPNDPWSNGGFPESITLSNLSGNNSNQNFVAIKVGDVTDSAIPNDSLGNNNISTTRSSEGNFELLIDKKINTEDGSGYIDVLAENFTEMSAFQLDMIFNNNELVFEKIESHALNVMDGNKLLEDGILTLVWYDKTGDTRGKTFDDGTVLFRLYFQGLTTTTFPIQQLFGITEATTLPNAYTSDGSPKEIYLKPFISERPKTHFLSEFNMLQNSPNPFTETTNIIFSLPVDDEVTFEIFTVQGKVVHSVNRIFSEGENIIEVNSDDLPHSGIYYYRIQTSSYDRMLKMIYLK